MRIKNNVGSRKSNVREVKSKYLLFFEGEKTEEIYFTELISHNGSLITNIYYYLRDDDKKGWSNPEKMLELIEPIVEKKENAKFTYETVEETIVEYISNNITSISTNNIKEAYNDSLSEIQVNLKDKLDVNTFEEVIKITIKKLENKYSIVRGDVDLKYLIKYITEATTYDPEVDKIYLIVDRDKKSFTQKQYKNVLSKTKQYNINLIVTNPCFEFWLLLHFDDCLKIDKGLLLSNDKTSTGNTFVFDKLREYDSNYRKNNFDKRMYFEKSDTAINNSKQYQNDVEKLINEVGTNIVPLIQMILDKSE